MRITKDVLVSIAGKTTLLKRILRLNNERGDEDKLKMAVIGECENVYVWYRAVAKM